MRGWGTVAEKVKGLRGPGAHKLVQSKAAGRGTEERDVPISESVWKRGWGSSQWLQN